MLIGPWTHQQQHEQEHPPEVTEKKQQLDRNSALKMFPDVSRCLKKIRTSPESILKRDLNSECETHLVPSPLNQKQLEFRNCVKSSTAPPGVLHSNMSDHVPTETAGWGVRTGHRGEPGDVTAGSGDSNTRTVVVTAPTAQPLLMLAAGRETVSGSGLQNKRLLTS